MLRENTKHRTWIVCILNTSYIIASIPLNACDLRDWNLACVYGYDAVTQQQTVVDLHMEFHQFADSNLTLHIPCKKHKKIYFYINCNKTIYVQELIYLQM